jgi:hypothetical protein
VHTYTPKVQKITRVSTAITPPPHTHPPTHTYIQPHVRTDEGNPLNDGTTYTSSKKSAFQQTTNRQLFPTTHFTSALSVPPSSSSSESESESLDEDLQCLAEFMVTHVREGMHNTPERHVIGSQVCWASYWQQAWLATPTINSVTALMTSHHVGLHTGNRRGSQHQP